MGNKISQLHPKTVHELILHIDVEFTAEEIRHWYEDFKKSCNKGKNTIDMQGFIRIYNSLFKGDGFEFARHVFRTFDTNNDGVVDFTEFIVGLCVSGSSDYETKMRWAFDIYDENKDDHISRQEMTSVIRAVYKMAFPQGVEESYTAENLVSEVFESIDKNEDNIISWMEFHEGVNHHPLLIKLLHIYPEQE